MPEGHTVHRIALQLEADLVGHRIRVSSPQGRFEAGARVLDGRTMTAARAVGKHLLVAFDGVDDGSREVLGVSAEHWLRVHLGLYGAWDFHGQVSPLTPGRAAAGSLGAPRVRRGVRMGEGEQVLGEAGEADGPVATFPPEPVGQVRVRLATGRTVADLRGPTACQVLTPDEVAAVVAAAGPDPRVPVGPDPQGTFVSRLRARRTPVGVLLMDQSVVSGIGNIYRAEMLFRARLNPRTSGAQVPAEVARELWADWEDLLDDGVRTGVMITRADLDAEQRERALTDRTLRHAVYGRAGEPCLVCGTPIALEEVAGRKLYWCPVCQA